MIPTSSRKVAALPPRVLFLVTLASQKCDACRTIRLLLVLLGTFAVIQTSHAMPADAQRPENAESAQVGREVAQRHCSGCHATGPTGLSPNPKSPPFPLIAERFENDNPAPVLIDGTVVRHPGMPEFRLLEHETDGLVAYIRRISRRWKPAVD